MLEAVQQSKLIHKDGPQSEPLCVDQPFGRYLTVTIENAFELLVEVLYSSRAQLVKDATYFYTLVSMRVRTVLRRYQEQIGFPTLSLHIGRIVMDVA